MPDIERRPGMPPLEYELQPLPRSAGDLMSKLQARMLMVCGRVVCPLVAVLQYTLFEYEAAWLALGAFGVAGISVGLYHIWSRVLAVLIGAVLLAAGCYGAGFLIASSAASLFAWSAR